MNNLFTLTKRYGLGLLIAVYLAQVQAANKTVKAQAKIKAPVWSIRDIDNHINSLAAYKGKVVILNFWGTFCTPCLKEVPDLVAIQQQYAGKVVVIGAAMDKNGENKIKLFAKKYSINYPVIIAPGSLLNEYKVVFAPVTFIIDKEGDIVFKQTGAITRDELARLITPLL
jgi:thiol-disulfide isomerase/thioredoxin